MITKASEMPGKRRGRYIPKFYVFRGFHLSTCYPWITSSRSIPAQCRTARMICTWASLPQILHSLSKKLFMS